MTPKKKWAPEPGCTCNREPSKVHKKACVLFKPLVSHVAHVRAKQSATADLVHAYQGAYRMLYAMWLDHHRTELGYVDLRNPTEQLVTDDEKTDPTGDRWVGYDRMHTPRGKVTHLVKKDSGPGDPTRCGTYTQSQLVYKKRDTVMPLCNGCRRP